MSRVNARATRGEVEEEKEEEGDEAQKPRSRRVQRVRYRIVDLSANRSLVEINCIIFNRMKPPCISASETTARRFLRLI